MKKRRNAPLNSKRGVHKKIDQRIPYTPLPIDEQCINNHNKTYCHFPSKTVSRVHQQESQGNSYEKDEFFSYC